MQKKKQTQTKPVKQIILFIIAVILLLLIIFAEDIIKLTNKNKINLAENPENELISNEPNIPQLSAGMIPVKWDGTNWVITTSKDKDWYDYANGKPAYIMLNDGKYQSELIRDMTNKELAKNNVGVGVPEDPNIRGTIYLWIPRFAYKESGEIGYVKEEFGTSGEWIVPEMFSYIISDETKPDFLLSGVWVEKDTDKTYISEVGEMLLEEGKYGFIANTKPKQITLTDINIIQNYINMLTANTAGNDALVVPIINDITNSNRIILQIVNSNNPGPIKAKLIHNTTEQKLEIQVTYTANGIREILDEYGEQMTLTEENGRVFANTGKQALVTGRYSFTIVDNKNNKKELSIYISVDSNLYSLQVLSSYFYNNANTYQRTQATVTATEKDLLNKLKTIDTTTTYVKAIQGGMFGYYNYPIVAIEERERTDEDEQLYIYGEYTQNSWGYNITRSSTYTEQRFSSSRATYGSYSYNLSTRELTLNGPTRYNASGYSMYRNSLESSASSNATTTSKTSSFYYWEYVKFSGSYYYWHVYPMSIVLSDKGNFINYLVDLKDTYPENGVKDNRYYTLEKIAPKYTLYRYDEDFFHNISLKCMYDVDTATITTVPIDISKKGKNKLKLTLNASGTDYKTYISNDNATWQEVTDITSEEPKELNVDGWDNLYIKIEINTSTINSIDVAYYKD